MIIFLSLGMTLLVSAWHNKYPISVELAYFLGVSNVSICVAIIEIT